MRRRSQNGHRSSGTPAQGRRPRYLLHIGALLAVLLALLTPWPGPHIDHYFPLIGVAIGASGQEVDSAFWLLWGGLCIGFALVWFVCLLVVWALFKRWVI